MSTLQDALTSVLPELRSHAEARMTSRCAVMRTTGDTTPNPDGFEVDEWAAVHADLPLRLAGGEGFRAVTIGETETQVAVREAHLPAATSDLRDGDLIEVTEGENAGAVLRIVEASWQDQATARRVPVVEATRPEEWA